MCSSLRWKWTAVSRLPSLPLTVWSWAYCISFKTNSDKTKGTKAVSGIWASEKIQVGAASEEGKKGQWSTTPILTGPHWTLFSTVAQTANCPPKPIPLGLPMLPGSLPCFSEQPRDWILANGTHTQRCICLPGLLQSWVPWVLLLAVIPFPDWEENPEPLEATC